MNDIQPNDVLIAIPLAKQLATQKERATQAIELLESAVVQCQMAFGENHYATLQCRFALCDLYEEHDWLDQALDLRITLLEIARKTKGRSSEATAFAFYNVGSLYLEKVRRKDSPAPVKAELLEKSIQHLGSAVRLAEALPLEQESIALFHGTLAEAYKYVGDLDRALEHMLTRYRMEAASAAHDATKTHECVSVMHFIVDIYKTKEQYDMAIDLCNRAMDMMKTSGHGALHPDMGMTLQLLASAYASQGDNTQAIKHYEQSLAVYTAETEWPQQRNQIASVYVGLANIYSSNHDYDRAIEHFTKAAAYMAPTYHLGRHGCNFGRAMCFMRKGDNDTAHTYWLAALDGARGAYGETSEHTALVYYNLALTARDGKHSGGLKQALEYAFKAKFTAVRALGPNSEQALSYGQLADELSDSFRRQRQQHQSKSCTDASSGSGDKTASSGSGSGSGDKAANSGSGSGSGDKATSSGSGSSSGDKAAMPAGNASCSSASGPPASSSQSASGNDVDAVSLSFDNIKF